MSHHPTDCACPEHALASRERADEAHAQTLALFDELDGIHRRLRVMQTAVNAEIDALCTRIARHIGPEP
jgi:hypothetical protein